MVPNVRAIRLQRDPDIRLGVRLHQTSTVDPFPEGAEGDQLTFIDGGSPDPVAKTPPNLTQGTYKYLCRIHPWMRGVFKVEK